MTIRTIRILQTSEYSRKILSGNEHGIVHSVYRKTINLQFNGQLLALQSKDSPLSPISLITELTEDEMETLALTSGMPVTILHSCNTPYCIPAKSRTAADAAVPAIHIQLKQNLILSLETAEFSDLLLSCSLSEESLQSIEKLCLETLRLRSTGSFELLFTAREKAMDILFLKAADLRLTAAETALKNQNWQKAADSLCGLIGLGLGLTPGGDDFLCGVLAGLILCGISPFQLYNSQPCTDSLLRLPLTAHPFTCVLTTQLQNHLCNTNDISAAFLHCALKGQFSLAVNLLPKLKTSYEILSVFSEIGHSSGTDTLCGIYFILKNRKLF